MKHIFWVLCQIGCIIAMLLNVDNSLWVLYTALLGVSFAMMIISLHRDEEDEEGE